MIFLITLLVLALFGRLACSTICPLGILEELIYKIPFPKKFGTFKIDKYLMKLKYLVFILLVILIPLVFIPHKEELKAFFLVLKIIGFSSVFLLSIIIYRPFCKFLCPFGVVLGLGNKISPYRFEVHDDCTKCGLCSRSCSMNITPFTNPNSMDCIRCNKCIKKCPRKAITIKKYKGDKL